jgi:hypothetical protein
MENHDIVSIEMELDRLRDEREEKEKSAPATGATGATGEKSGCGKMLLYFVLGILLIKGFGEIISIFFSN